MTFFKIIICGQYTGVLMTSNIFFIYFFFLSPYQYLHLRPTERNEERKTFLSVFKGQEKKTVREKLKTNNFC